MKVLPVQQLGDSLVFYLRYWPEMDCLDRSVDQRDFQGLQDRELVRKTASEVRRTADDEAQQFLEACARGIEERLRCVCKLRRIRHRKKLERGWRLSYEIWQNVRSKSREVRGGVTIDKRNARVVVWVWSKGGEPSEAALAAAVGDRVAARSRQLGWPAGNLALALIPVPAGTGGAPGEDAYFQHVIQAFESLRADLEPLFKESR
jgi:hypothetical protein